jgi:predicted Zn-dependent protease
MALPSYIAPGVNEDFAVEELVKKLRANASNPSFSDADTLLSLLRERKIRRYDLVCLYGPILLEKHASKLGDSVWAVREQVAVAAAVSGHASLAKTLTQELAARFPESFRVRRLTAMLEEAGGHYSLALTKYAALLTEDKTDLLTMKRCVAIRREQGLTDEAIQQLIAILKHFPADQESWLELADLYLSTQAYVTAAHCLEELMLISPENYHFCTRYAEIQHTIGTAESLRLALKYFCLSLELHSEGNLRAAYGGLMVWSSVLSLCSF